MNALWQDIPDEVLESLDERLQTEYEYYEGDTAKNEFDDLCLGKDGFSFKREDWSKVHKWLLIALKDFCETLEPFVKDADPLAYEMDEDDDEEDDGDFRKDSLGSED